MDHSTGEKQQMRLPFLSEQTQKHSIDRVKGFCIFNTQKDKDKNASIEENDYVTRPPHLDPVESIADKVFKDVQTASSSII